MESVKSDLSHITCTWYVIPCWLQRHHC